MNKKKFFKLSQAQLPFNGFTLLSSIYNILPHFNYSIIEAIEDFL